MDQLKSILDAVTLSTVLKWALVVLVAGFIGQFGRKFAEYLIERARIKKNRSGLEPVKSRSSEAQENLPAEGGGEIARNEKREEASDPSKEEKERLKAEKKAAKALIKQKKKEVSSN